MRCDSTWFPAEHEVAYVASWAGIGGVCGFLAWIVVDSLWPELQFDAGAWMQIGAGFVGAIALAWVLTGAVLH